ncbi:MAG: PIN domain-containing protein [Caldimonas sp.]
MNRSPRRVTESDAPIFFDSNVLVYAYDPHENDRRGRALSLIAEAMRTRRFTVSAQVMQEFYNTVLRRRFLGPFDALAFLELLAEHTVVHADAHSVLRAIALQQRYRISVWDALIVQSALDASCATLFSEDMQDGQRFAAIGDAALSVTIVNPFAPGSPALGSALHEPSPTYAAAEPKRKSATARLPR